MKQLTHKEGIEKWNSALREVEGELPFAFSPDLWNLYTDYFHWKPYYVFFKSGDEIKALLPLVFTGRAWVSLPHMSHGGVLFLKSQQKTDSSFFINYTIKELKGKESGFYEMEIPLSKNIIVDNTKYFIRSTSEHHSKSFKKSEKQNSFLFLESSQKEMFQKLSSNLRRKIRKAEEIGIIIKSGNKELINDFYTVYTKNISRLKSMPYPKSYFIGLTDVFGNLNNAIFVAYLNNRPIGVAFMATYAKYHENIYFATLKEYQKHYVSDLLHWAMIKECIERSEKSKFSSKSVYSFGRSTGNSGVYEYKNHWPVENEALYVYTNLPDMRKKEWLNKLWSLLPVFVRKVVGVRLVRDLY